MLEHDGGKLSTCSIGFIQFESVPRVTGFNFPCGGGKVGEVLRLVWNNLEPGLR